MAQIAQVAIGATVGFFLGGAVGALAGAGLALAASALMPGVPGMDGPRLSDLAVQTSTYGVAIPRVYGTISVAGNVIWLENNTLREVVKKKKSGGKGGGGGSTTRTYTYFATFHLALCSNEIQGIRRIWCSDKLIYDAGSDDLETIISSNDAAKAWTLYTGTDDQLPTARYEADVGVDKATGNRGIAYLEFRDFALADYGNTLEGSQFKVELVSNSSAVGLRKVTDAASGKTYSSASYLFASGAVTRASLGSSATEHNLSGALIRTFIPDARDVMPANNNGYNYIGKLGGEFVAVKITDEAFVNGIDLIQDGNLGVTVGVAGIGGKKLVLATVSSDGRHMILLLTDPSNSISAEASGSWHILNQSFLEVGSGATIDASPLLGVGVSSRLNFGASVLSDDLTHFISAYGAGVRDLTAYRLADWSSVTLIFTFLSAQAFSRPSIRESDGVVTVLANDRFFQFVNTDKIAEDNPGISQVVSKECQLSQLITASDIDVSELSKTLNGYRVSGGALRASLEPLATAYQFDAIQSGYKIKFVPRGSASVRSVPYADLGATSSGSVKDVFKQSREMDSQLPAKTTVKYLDSAREYEASEQSSSRINTEAVNEQDVELALVLGADEAAGIAEMLQSRGWLERSTAQFSLPATYLGLEPADVITVTTPGAVYDLSITEIDYTEDGRLEISAKPSNAAVYTPAASGGEGQTPSGTIGLSGPSLFVPLDIPLVDEISQNAPGFVGAMTGYGSGWTGGTALKSADGGQTWTDVQGYAGQGGIGSTTGTLAASDGFLIDSRTLSVLMVSGVPESITRDQMLAGFNYAAYGKDGRWEIVRFQTAALQPSGAYLLSDFVRGDKGTEWATGLHVASDFFILLDDPDNAFIGMPIASIGLDETFRGITQGADIGSGLDVPFSYDAVNLETLSPVYAQATRDGSGNLSATFNRRSRLGSTWWGNGLAAPVGEANESYQIDVMAGSVVKRTIEAATPAFTYSAANQVTDFGSAQSSITFRIFQLSETVGRGYVREVTL